MKMITLKYNVVLISAALIQIEKTVEKIRLS